MPILAGETRLHFRAQAERHSKVTIAGFPPKGVQTLEPAI
jgi:hypothetical protein